MCGIDNISKDSVPVYIMDIAPENTLIHRKATSSDNLVWTVSTLKGLHTSSKLIHLMSQHIPVETSSAL